MWKYENLGYYVYRVLYVGCSTRSYFIEACGSVKNKFYYHKLNLHVITLHKPAEVALCEMKVHLYNLYNVEWYAMIVPAGNTFSSYSLSCERRAKVKVTCNRKTRT